SFDKVHTKPGLSAAEGSVIFTWQTKQDPPYPGAGLLTQRTLKNADDFALIRWPEGGKAIVEIRNSIHKICSVMRSPQRVLPENELTCYGLRMGLMEYVKNRNRTGRSGHRQGANTGYRFRMNDLR